MSTTKNNSRKRTRTQRTRSKSRSKSPTDITMGSNGIDYIAVELPNKIHLLPNSPLEKKLFKIEYDLDNGLKCINYIDDANKHVIFKDKLGRYILFNIYGEPVKEDVIELCKNKLKSKNKKQKTAHYSLAKDIIMLESCKIDIDLKAAQIKLEELNIELSKKCKGLTMKLDPFYEYTEPMYRFGYNSHVCLGCGFYENIILALCNNDNCISTIELIIEPYKNINDEMHKTIRINSKTDKTQEGKKYNKMLRSVLLILSAEIETIDYIKSIATNPYSAWLLIKYSNAKIEYGDPFEKYLQSNNLSLENINQSVINSYYENNGNNITLIIEINAENALKSQKVFENIINNEIKC